MEVTFDDSHDRSLRAECVRSEAGMSSILCGETRYTQRHVSTCLQVSLNERSLENVSAEANANVFISCHAQLERREYSQDRLTTPL